MAFNEWATSHWAAIRRCIFEDASLIVFTDSSIQLTNHSPKKTSFPPSLGNNYQKTALALIKKKWAMSYRLERKAGTQTRQVSSLPARHPEVGANQLDDHLRIKPAWPPKAFFQRWQMTYCAPAWAFPPGSLVDSGCERVTANACHPRGRHSSSCVIRSTCRSNPPLKYPIQSLATHDLEVQRHNTCLLL